MTRTALPSEYLKETVRAIHARVAEAPSVGVVLGSGLGSFADTLDSLQKIPYGVIPHLPASKVVGHAGNLCFGKVGNTRVVCMQGRVHSYEGHPLWQVVHGVRTMAKLGVKSVLITNAAGGVDRSFSAGDLMLITDHLNLTGTNVLIGENDPELGVRFPDMSHAYDARLNDSLRAIAAKENLPLREGVYAGLSGPTYETPAEIRMLAALGASAVGMSTVQEVIALRHMGIPVGALSCITNMGAGILNQTLNHSEVEEVAREKKESLLILLRGWIQAAGERS